MAAKSSFTAVFLCSLSGLTNISTGLYAAAPCKMPAPLTNRDVRPGFVEFMSADQLASLKAALPTVNDSEVRAAMSSQDTMWYDETSMVFLYQDSVEVVVGGRANCVGRVVGETNKAPIDRLKNIFGPDYRFVFPFRTAAGTDKTTNTRVINFWVPPRQNGVVIPTKYWQDTARSHWHWIFPVGTLFGEVLFEQDPTGNYHVFEIRTRKRYSDGWLPNVYRPFRTAKDMAKAIIAQRPNWQMSPNLTTVIAHLQDNSKIVANQWSSAVFNKAFEPINGALDLVPEIDDVDLVKDLLSKYPFVSMEGAVWKRNAAGLETYAPGSAGAFNIVPKNYEMGMVPVNEDSCNRCHVQTSHPLGDFDSQLILYGEVWGEDRIFTWHLFQPNNHIFSTWDDTDVSRVVNPAMVKAGLVVKAKPQANDPVYKKLPVPYKEIR